MSGDRLVQHPPEGVENGGVALEGNARLVALVVPDALPAAELAETLREGAGPLLESLRLFDLYTGPQAGEGRKSLAFAMRFRAADRTLTDEEVTAARDAAVSLAVERHGAELRA